MLKKYLLCSSILALSLGCASPAWSMMAEDEESPPIVAIRPATKDLHAQLLRAALSKGDTAALTQELMNRARAGEGDAQRILCGVYASGMGNITKDAARMTEILELGLRGEGPEKIRSQWGKDWVKPWVTNYVKSTKDEDMKASVYLVSYNYGLNEGSTEESTERYFLDKHFGFDSEYHAKNWMYLSSYFSRSHEKLLNFFENLKKIWELKPYAAPFVYFKDFLLHVNLNGIYDIQSLELAAQRGHVPSMAELGYFYDQNNNPNAIKWYEQAALAGDTEAMVNLGVLLEQRDPETTIRWYERAALTGNINAMFNLGNLLREKNSKSAKEWYEKAALAGDTQAMVNLGHLLHESNPKSAKEWYEKAALAGETKAMFNLGHLLKEEDPKAAIRRYKQAAKAGNKDAMYGLGYLIEKQGDTTTAIEWYKKAANAGHTDAMFKLGVILHHTHPKSSRRWYEKAIQLDHNNAHALHNLALLLLKTDPSKAEKYLFQAAHKNNSKSMISLASILLDKANRSETEAEKHLERAFFFIEKAEALGNPEAKILKDMAQKKEEELNSETDEDKDEKIIEEAFAAAARPQSATMPPSKPSIEGEERPAQSAPLPLLEPEDQDSSSPSDSEEEIEEEIVPEPVVSPKSNNPKWNRQKDRLRAAYRANEERKKEDSEQPKISLSRGSQDIVEMLKTKPHKVSFKTLKTLFEADSYFKGQVDVARTASGVRINAIHVNKGEIKSTGTHKPHGPRNGKKGYDPNFIRDVQDILKLFDVE